MGQEGWGARNACSHWDIPRREKWTRTRLDVALQTTYRNFDRLQDIRSDWFRSRWAEFYGSVDK
jgi:hypothetical protein